MAWKGVHHTIPCNFDNFEFYETRPHSFRAGVREFRGTRERLYVHHGTGALPSACCWIDVRKFRDLLEYISCVCVRPCASYLGYSLTYRYT